MSVLQEEVNKEDHMNLLLITFMRKQKEKEQEEKRKVEMNNEEI